MWDIPKGVSSYRIQSQFWQLILQNNKHPWNVNGQKWNSTCFRTDFLASFFVKGLLVTWRGGYFLGGNLSLTVPLQVFPNELWNYKHQTVIANTWLIAKFSFKLVCNDAPSLLQVGEKKDIASNKRENVIADEALMLLPVSLTQKTFQHYIQPLL